MISPERAAEIKRLAQKRSSQQWEKEVTNVTSGDEKQFIMRHWSALPDTATLSDVIDNFIAGNTTEQG